LQITNENQPLLRISNALKHYDHTNCIVQNTKHCKAKIREEFLKQKKLLLPEMVNIHTMPASLWREGQLIPFVIEKGLEITNENQPLLRNSNADKDGH